MEFIDFRARPPTPEFNSYFIPETTIRGNLATGARYVSPAYLKGSIELFFEEMEEAGITQAVTIGRNAKALNPKQNGFIPNDHIYNLMQKYPSKIIGVAGIDLANEVHNALEETERCVRLGFKAIHIEPGRSLVGYPNDKRIFPLYEKCIELDIPVVLMSGPLAGPNLEYANPVHIEDVSVKFPNLKVVAGHGCWPWVTQIIGVCFKCGNVYICPDSFFFMPGADQYVQAANTFLQDRFLFGTAYPYRPLRQTVEDFKTLAINPSAMEKIAYKNTKKLLKL